MRSLAIILLLIPLLPKAQHTGFSFEMMNEIGTYKLVSLTFSHDTDNIEGITYVIHRQESDTVYFIDEFLNGYVALSTDGRTIAHLITEKDGKPLKASILTFYRNGEKFDSAELQRFIKYFLDDQVASKKLPESGWLRNDSLFHKMASNPFFITDDKLFISFEKPVMMVFDMNRMFHIYTGNGANHFSQNYYSIPNMPYRVEYDSAAYSPKGLPLTGNGKTFEELIVKVVGGKISDAESADTKVSVEFKLSRDSSIEIRKAEIDNLRSGKMNAARSEALKTSLSETSFSSTLIPPHHPAWIFNGVFWLK